MQVLTDLITERLSLDEPVFMPPSPPYDRPKLSQGSSDVYTGSRGLPYTVTPSLRYLILFLLTLSSAPGRAHQHVFVSRAVSYGILARYLYNSRNSELG